MGIASLNPFDWLGRHFRRRAGFNDPQPTQQKPRRPTTQLKFSKREMEALMRQIQQDYWRAIEDHNVRIDRCAEQEKSWRNWVGLQGGEQGKSNFKVPFVLALVLTKWAREIDALFGTNATVEAEPATPQDDKIAKKVSLAMKWQVFKNMACMKPLALVILRRLKHGRSFAHLPWITKFYNKTTVDPITGERKTERKIYYEGPEIQPLGNDEIIFPASLEGKTGFDDIQNVEWIIRRYWDTPTNMLAQDNEPEGEQNPEGDWYQGIKQNWKKIVLYARFGLERDSQKDPSLIEDDLAEGILRDSSTTMQREQIEIWEWHGHWRRWAEQPPAENAETAMGGDTMAGVDFNKETPSTPVALDPGKEDQAGEIRPANAGLAPGAEEDQEFSSPSKPTDDGTFIDTDGIRKYMVESNLIVRYSDRLRLIVGIQDADEVYPDTPNKRPFFDMRLLNDGQAWPMGLMEMIQDIENELTVLANKVIQAVDFSIAPPIFAEPNVGESVANRKYETYDVIWVANAAGVKQMAINPNLQPFAELWQMFISLQEMLTGLTQNAMGRGMEQPNAPRTLGGQRLLMGAGDVRLALDMRMLSEDLKKFLDMVWDEWTMFGSEQNFFRVADGDAQGLFEHGELQNGWAQLGAKERQGKYDFSLSFADDAQVKEGKKQELAQLMQLMRGFPVAMQDPVLQYRFLVDVFDAFGLDFTKYSKEPAPGFAPQTPENEWSSVLHKNDIHVHPQDNDEAHISDHQNRIMAMWDGPEADHDLDAMTKMRDHINEHQNSLVQKRQTQELMQGLQSMLGMIGSAAGAKPGQGGQQNPLDALIAGLQGGMGQPGAGAPQGQIQPGR